MGEAFSRQVSDKKQREFQLQEPSEDTDWVLLTSEFPVPSALSSTKEVANGWGFLKDHS